MLHETHNLTFIYNNTSKKHTCHKNIRDNLLYMSMINRNQNNTMETSVFCIP